jgi:hypothetical protein
MLMIFSGALLIYLIAYLAVVNYIIWDDYEIRYAVSKSNEDVKIYRGILMGNNAVTVVLLILLGIKLYNYDHETKTTSKATKYSLIAFVFLCLVYVSVSIYFLDDKYSSKIINENFSTNYGLYLTIGLLISIIIYQFLLFPIKLDTIDKTFIRSNENTTQSLTDQNYIDQGKSMETERQRKEDEDEIRKNMLISQGTRSARDERDRRDTIMRKMREEEEELDRLRSENSILFDDNSKVYDSDERTLALAEEGPSPSSDKEVNETVKKFDISFS